MLLWMPDTVGLLEAAYISDGSGAHVHVSDNDPRRAGEVDAPPGFRRAPTLVATLQEGDALHIPCAWFHYVETGSTSPPDDDVLSVAVSVRTRTNTADDASLWNMLWNRLAGAKVPEGFVEAPCDS